jgi:hypothetical protein
MNEPIKPSKKKAWTWFSIYIRLRDSDEKGFAPCFTCGKTHYYKEMHAGHFLQGRHVVLLFNEYGVHSQCYRCNIELYGNQIKYYIHMIQLYGQSMVNKLMKLDELTVSLDAKDYDVLAEKYKDLVNKLLKIKNL